MSISHVPSHTSLAKFCLHCTPICLVPTALQSHTAVQCSTCRVTFQILLTVVMCYNHVQPWDPHPAATQQKISVWKHGWKPAGKGTCHQSFWPQFDSRNLHCGWEEGTLWWLSSDVSIHTHTHIHYTCTPTLHTYIIQDVCHCTSPISSSAPCSFLSLTTVWLQLREVCWCQAPRPRFTFIIHRTFHHLCEIRTLCTVGSLKGGKHRHPLSHTGAAILRFPKDFLWLFPLPQTLIHSCLDKSL